MGATDLISALDFAKSREETTACSLQQQVVEEATESILATTDMEALLRRTARMLGKYFGSTRVGLTRWDSERPDLVQVLQFADPRHPVPARGVLLDLAGTARHRALESRRPLILRGIQAEPDLFSDSLALARLGYDNLACFPLLFVGKVLGTLEVACRARDDCDGLFEAAERLARLLAIALHNSSLTVQLQAANESLRQENALLRDQVSLGDEEFIVASPEMEAVLADVNKVAETDMTVLLMGETGTGKEVLARQLHQQSKRRARPFVGVNLGAIPEGLVESALFGHEAGAFTGANQRRDGWFQRAQGGTLFLDEIGDATPAVQVRLLRVLEERQIEPLGSERSAPVDVRVVAAAGADLDERVRSGRFRADLYYRLAIYPLRVPPLRERSADLLPLITHFVRKHAARLGRPMPQLEIRNIDGLVAYAWPGNVRELENFVERELLLSDRDRLVLDRPPNAWTLDLDDSVLVSGRACLDLGGGFDEVVQGLMVRTLTETRGQVYGPDGAAARLGLKPTTLQGKLRKIGLNPVDFR